jgi:hypothetical protein
MAARTLLALALGAVLFASGIPQAFAAKRHIVVTAVEPKGGTHVDREKFPEKPLPDGKGYGLKPPNEEGRWEVSVYVWDPRQIFVDEGDEVTLEFVGINGASHPTTISGYDKTFELKRGEVNKLTFVADKPGRFDIVCSTHHPTMVAELIVAPKK